VRFAPVSFIGLPQGRDAVKGKDYEAWAGQYIHFPCAEQVSGRELYAARCGVLHTFTPDSDLSRTKQARRIVYINAHTPEVSYDANEPENIVVMSVQGLYKAFVTGVQQYLADLHSDKAREAQAIARLGTMFHDVQRHTI
jgi:hypothetical protein